MPACWQAEGHDLNGAAWYRLRFVHRPGDTNVARLGFLGVDHFADVWLNGYFLGSHEGFFNHFESMHRHRPPAGLVRTRAASGCCAG